MRARLERLTTRAAALTREEPLLIAGTVFAALSYATFSVLDHVHLGTSTFDLAIFDQAIWLYSVFEAPASTITAGRSLPHLLGDHFHPILISLAPLYWVWEDARVLLIAQALLIASSAIPVFLFARPRIGRPAAYLLTVAYLGFWGIQAALNADFHEVAFAPPLIALAILAADRERWGWCLGALGMLLLVKEDLAIFVAFFGLYLLTLRRVKLGLGTLAAGTVAYFLIVELAIPHFAGGGEFSYWSYPRLGDDLPDALWNMTRSPWLPFEVMVTPFEKAETTLRLVLVPFLGLALLSRELILAVPLLLERMLSSRASFWGTTGHYSLAIAPVLAMGTASGLATLLRKLPRDIPRPRAAVTVTALMLATGLVVSPNGHPLGKLVTPGYYTRSDREHAAAEAIVAVPAHSGSVLAQNTLLPHLSQRRLAFELATNVLAEDSRAQNAEYVVYDGRNGLSRALVADHFDRYRVVFERLGYTVLQRDKRE